MTIRITLKRALLGVLAVVLLALAVGWSGAINVAASSGHWKVTEWFLHWVMRNSVQTRSYWQAPEGPADPSGLVSAAGHFALSCAGCHGAPGQRPSPVMQGATPPAPNLSINAREWTDRQLFWILQHGVKYSGMPAWPAKGREDEVRRMVAFVRRLPGMTPAQYRELTGGPFGVQGQGRFEACAGCHGQDGRGRGQPDIPVLGGQRADYLLASLRAYQTGHRNSAVMGNAVAPLPTEALEPLAQRFAALPGLGGSHPSAADPLAWQIIHKGLPDRELPACASCHTTGKRYPVLEGQKASYLAARLRGWRGAKETVDARKSHATMPVIARRIPEELIDRIAKAYATAER
ncbi:cytochrome c553 [Novosphingobium chloroacetimidivorans]|uniref:Cytochrome c553 n=1 Tax=Novosphingobium chloroacetimidivorans TaxID=1428314 RepID=A0A7W7KA56_9SPHN|nr:c-type cytochrome [Novosphingobium chloroacetimidivorans]MBB4858348.1 cytochrome c553 [Novosphingobium chloroacetimidivorans]